MAIKEYRFNTGPDGAAAAAGDGFASSPVDIAKYAAAQNVEGTFGLLMSQAATSLARAEFTMPDHDQIAITFYYKQVSKTGTQGQQFMSLYTTTSGVAALQMSWANSNQISIKNPSGSIETFALTPSANDVALNTWYRFSIVLNRSTNSITIKIYNGLTDAQLFTYTSAAWGTWSAYTVMLIGGLQNDRTGTFVHALDYVAYETARSTELPKPSSIGTPAVTVVSATKPTTLGGTDGTIVVSWPAVAGATRYESGIAPGNVSSGFVVKSTAATSPYTFTALAAGQYTVAIKAISE